MTETRRSPAAGRRTGPASPVPLLVGALLFAASAAAVSPPHWESSTLTIDCASCHIGHDALGGLLTSAAGNANLCQSCHTASGIAGDRPINNVDVASPGVGGTSHAFGVDPVNSSLDTQTPLNSDMAVRLIDGQVSCSTCHDQHGAFSSERGTSRISQPKQITAAGSTGTLSSGGTYSGAEGLWYLIEISQAGNETNARFIWSNDNGNSWQPEEIAGVDVPLNNGVTVTFNAGNFVNQERWEFYGSWPFLQSPMDQGPNDTGDNFCRDCHRSWVMGHDTDADGSPGGVETWDGSWKSHPVGITLNANAEGYDRATPLDGNGAVQDSGGADTNASNDLKFDAESRVGCLTCHGIHYADSNTLTEDGP